MKFVLSALVMFALIATASSQGRNANAHRTGDQAWTSPDAVGAAQRIEAHAKDLGLTHSQIMTIHSINQRTNAQLAGAGSAPTRARTRRIIIGAPTNPALQALQQIQRMLNLHQKEIVVRSGWLN